jgi:conserved oligomeric Golgi complex subunit 7
LNVLESLLFPIKSFLSHIPRLQIWNSTASDIGLEKFSLSPSAYITSVGEHLLTLPHLFDPYIQEDALMVSVETLPNYDASQMDGEEVDLTFAWIFSAIKLTERLLLDQLFLIRNLSLHGTKQIITDLEYLQNVMAALEIDSDKDLQGLLESLEKPSDELQHSSNELSHKICQMKGIY